MAVINKSDYLSLPKYESAFGFYPKATASRLARIPRSTLALWDKNGIVPAVASWINERDQEAHGYTFEALVYLRLIRMLKEIRPSLPMRKIVRTVQWLVRQFGPPSSNWASARIWSDRHDLWIQSPVLAAASREGQIAIPGYVIFDEEFALFSERLDGLLIPLEFAPWVGMEPRLRNGMPLVRGTGIETATIHAAFAQGLSVNDLRRRYPFLNETQISQSERFESFLDVPVDQAG